MCIDDGNDKVSGHVLCDQVKSLDWQHRNTKKHTTLAEDYVVEIIGRLDSLIWG